MLSATNVNLCLCTQTQAFTASLDTTLQLSTPRPKAGRRTTQRRAHVQRGQGCRTLNVFHEGKCTQKTDAVSVDWQAMTTSSDHTGVWCLGRRSQTRRGRPKPRSRGHTSRFPQEDLERLSVFKINLIAEDKYKYLQYSVLYYKL